MTDSINESINDEAVCRTAPATPGLLITSLGDSKEILRSHRATTGQDKPSMFGYLNLLGQNSTSDWNLKPHKREIGNIFVMLIVVKKC